jgi:uncharacterized protein with NAD-binding domain and iron-sulfur cluster
MQENSHGNIECDVVIIGGGLAGLTCAIGLRDTGLSIIVVEQSGSLGGRARGWTDDKTGDPVDIGPHIFLSEYPNTLKLFETLGTRDRIIWHRDQFITIADGQHPIVMRMSPLPAPFHFVPSVLADGTVALWDKLSNVPVSLFAMQMDETDVQNLDRLTAAEFLHSMGVTQNYIDRFWAFVSMAIMNIPVEQCSAGALLRFYRHLIGHNNYYIGFPAAGLSNMFAPQARQLLEQSGVRLFLNTSVQRFTGDAASATGVQLANDQRISARFCVSAIPAHDLRLIIHNEWLDHYGLFNDLDSFAPCPYISTYLWFDRKLSERQFWARIYSSDDLNCDFYDLSNINPGWQNRPSVIACNIINSQRAAHLSDREIIEATIREIAGSIPDAIHAKVLHSVINRIPMAIHCPYPGTENKRPAAATPVRGLLLAGDWTRTGIPASMESAVCSGWLAAEKVLHEIGRPARLALSINETEGVAGMIRLLTKWLGLKRSRLHDAVG